MQTPQDIQYESMHRQNKGVVDFHPGQRELLKTIADILTVPRQTGLNRVCIRQSFDGIKTSLLSAVLPEVLSLNPGQSVTMTFRRAGESSWGDFVEITSS